MIKRFQYIIVALLLLATTGCGNRTNKVEDASVSHNADSGKAVISFSEVEHNFGQVKEGEKIGCIFTFINTGNANLVINSATTTCGCTVPKYDRKPIGPGGTGALEVIFDTEGRNGIQSKTITVRSNAIPPVTILKITAEVINNSNN
jgi:hypothetical protein